MSHVVTCEAQILDLDALEVACRQLGLELVRGQKTFRWYSRHMADFPLPAGFSAEDMGHCEHAIRVPGNSQAYEVGVVRRRDGKQGFCLMLDFWSQGKGLLPMIGGQNASKLVAEYGATVAMRNAARQGLRSNLIRRANGSVATVQFYR